MRLFNESVVTLTNGKILIRRKNTVNQLNFAAVKFRGLPIHALFRAIKFRVFWPTLLHKCGLNSLNNGPIFKIQSVSETRDRAPQYFACYLILRIW